MSDPWTLLLVLLALAASGAFSGSETALYSLSRVRVDVDARRGSWKARLVRRLMRRDTALLITILIGNNLALEIMTHLVEHDPAMTAVPAVARELVLTLCLTPVVFLFGEVLPKELFRRRPYTLLGWTAPVVAASRLIFWPLERVLSGLTGGLEHLLGVRAKAMRSFLDRESVIELFRQSVGGEEGGSPVVDLVQNVTRLRTIHVADVMVPWSKVVCIEAGRPNAALFEEVAGAVFTRLPLVDEAGAVGGYVVQLDVLAAGPESDVLAGLRPIEHLTAETTVARALARMRVAGLRAAVVGPPEAPQGLLTLKDLVEKISGDLADW